MYLYHYCTLSDTDRGTEYKSGVIENPEKIKDSEGYDDFTSFLGGHLSYNDDSFAVISLSLL